MFELSECSTTYFCCATNCAVQNSAVQVWSPKIRYVHLFFIFISFRDITPLKNIIKNENKKQLAIDKNNKLSIEENICNC